MFFLHMRMHFLIIAMFAIVYMVVAMVGQSMGVVSFNFYLILAIVIMLVQFMLGNSAHNLASALYKLVYGSARISKEAAQGVEGLKAFFVNDPSRTIKELSELKQIDTDLSGTIDKDELAAVRSKQVVLSTSDKLMELMSTHPNMLERIKRLSSYEHA